MGFAKPIERYLFGNLLTKMHVFMYLKDIIRGAPDMAKRQTEEKITALYGRLSRMETPCGGHRGGKGGPSAV